MKAQINAGVKEQKDWPLITLKKFRSVPKFYLGSSAIRRSWPNFSGAWNV